MDKTLNLKDSRSSEEVFAKSRLALSETIEVAGRVFSVDHIVARLREHVTEERWTRLNQVVGARTFQMVTVLENIYDRGNVSAVMRSAEAFGYLGFHLVDLPGAKFKAANRVSKGAEKWLDVRVHSSPQAAASALRNQGYKIYTTSLGSDMQIQDLDFSQNLAIVFGNEKEGATPVIKDLSDGLFSIPMKGFSQSFNISVAAALTFYHAHMEHDIRHKKQELPDSTREQILANYLLRCFDRPEIYLE